MLRSRSPPHRREKNIVTVKPKKRVREEMKGGNRRHGKKKFHQDVAEQKSMRGKLAVVKWSQEKRIIAAERKKKIIRGVIKVEKASAEISVLIYFCPFFAKKKKNHQNPLMDVFNTALKVYDLNTPFLFASSFCLRTT